MISRVRSSKFAVREANKHENYNILSPQSKTKKILIQRNFVTNSSCSQWVKPT